MKLFKKLMPIATVATAACAVAPMISSCGISMKSIDVTKAYTSQIGQATGEMTVTEANAHYFERKNLSDLMLDDVLMNVFGDEAPSKNYIKTLKAGINATVSKKTKVGEQDVYLLSGGLKFELELEGSYTPSLNEMTISFFDTASCELNLTNVPFFIDYQERESVKWHICIADWGENFANWKDLNWSMNFNINANISMLGIKCKLNETGKFNTKSSEADLEEAASFLDMISDGGSHHLANVVFKAS